MASARFVGYQMGYCLFGFTIQLIVLALLSTSGIIAWLLISNVLTAEEFWRLFFKAFNLFWSVYFNISF